MRDKFLSGIGNACDGIILYLRPESKLYDIIYRPIAMKLLICIQPSQTFLLIFQVFIQYKS